MSSALRRILRWLHSLAGWLLLYLALGGAVGFAIRRAYTPELSCLPFNSVFGLIQSSCRVDAVNWLWAIAVGWPRFLILPPALSIGLLKAGVKGAVQNDWNFVLHSFLNAAWWLLCSLPLILFLLAGVHYWRRRRPVLGTVAFAAVTVEILALGLIA